MDDSIPLSAFKIGINHDEYWEIARVMRDEIKRMSILERERILDIAEERLNYNYNDLYKIVIDMAYDRKIYEIAELDYVEGPPEGEKLFITSLTYFLLRKNNCI